MTIKNNKELLYALKSLSVFRSILTKKPTEAFTALLSAERIEDRLSFYGEFVSSLDEYGCSFSAFLKKAVFEDENIYIKSLAKNKKPSPAVESNAKNELEIFSFLSTVTPEFLFKEFDYKGYIPLFLNEKTDFAVEYEKRIPLLDKLGYGIFASYPMFKVQNGEIIPVDCPDEIGIDSFVGYENERQQVLDNTKVLSQGGEAANVLLYGDAGTGKSSTVKAAINLYFKEGVRLIEVRKDQLLSLSSVMGKIADNPLKFVIFIDDLSFNKNDDSFSMLKAALEGSASMKAKNAVIYATSNRRHIVKETFSDRDMGSDDIHRNDTVQELLSLSDRFGLKVYFSKPNKILYLDIVHKLAERKGITMKKEELDIKAEAFALSRGSRSPRAAEQFIKSLKNTL